LSRNTQQEGRLFRLGVRGLNRGPPFSLRPTAPRLTSRPFLQRWGKAHLQRDGRRRMTDEPLAHLETCARAAKPPLLPTSSASASPRLVYS
jgi:hypothetical protein